MNRLAILTAATVYACAAATRYARKYATPQSGSVRSTRRAILDYGIHVSLMVVTHAVYRATRYVPPNDSVVDLVFDDRVAVHTYDQRLADYITNHINEHNTDREWYDKDNIEYMEMIGLRATPHHGAAKIVFLDGAADITASDDTVKGFMKDVLRGKYRVNVV